MKQQSTMELVRSPRADDGQEEDAHADGRLNCYGSPRSCSSPCSIAAVANHRMFHEGPKFLASPIRQLELVHCSLAEGRGYDILNALNTSACSGTITELRFWGCGLGDGGVHVLTSTIKRCPNLRRMTFPLCNIDDDVLAEMMPAVRQLRRLEDLSLSSNLIGRNGCQALACLLRDPGCSLRHVNIDANYIDDECARILAKALGQNTQLESLCLAGNQHALAAGGWEAIRELLCDDSSVDATHRSNHALQSVGDRLYERDIVPGDVLRCLEYNRRCRGTEEAAVCKILWRHPHLDMAPFFDTELRMLPAVIGWFDRARVCTKGFDLQIDARQLSSLYQFARAMPMGFVPIQRVAGTKRRRCEI